VVVGVVVGTLVVVGVVLGVVVGVVVGVVIVVGVVLGVVVGVVVVGVVGVVGATLVAFEQKMKSSIVPPQPVMFTFHKIICIGLLPLLYCWKSTHN